MQIAVVCSVKDEGPFLVEWVTWYRMLGFQRIVVVTNDCTDHSPQLLDAMAAAGWVTHLRCTIPPGQRIEATKLALARNHKHVFRADWAFVCDVDEFLVVHVGANRVQDLIAYPDQPVQGIAINWRVYGNSGLTQWQDALSHRTFLRAAYPHDPSSIWYKSLFTDVRAFRKLDSQGPRGFRRDRAGLDPSAPAKPWVNTDGEVIPGWSMGAPESRTMPAACVAQNVAQVNHYMIRWTNLFRSGAAHPLRHRGWIVTMMCISTPRTAMKCLKTALWPTAPGLMCCTHRPWRCPMSRACIISVARITWRVSAPRRARRHKATPAGKPTWHRPQP